jgi:hypothetical protein
MPALFGKTGAVENENAGALRQHRSQAIVNLIAATTTQTGLRVKAARDTRRYEAALQVPDEVFARLRITPHAFHGDWNYTIAPRH